MVDRDQAIRATQVAVVVDEDVREFSQGRPEIPEGPRKPGLQLLRRHVVAALRHTHGDPLLGNPRAGEPDEAEDDRVPGGGRALQEAELVADGIGEDRLEHEALPALDQRVPQRSGEAHRRGGLKTERGGKDVGIDQAEAGVLEVDTVEGRLARAIRTRERDQNRPAVEELGRLQREGVNSRPTKRPVVLLPPLSVRTSIPGQCRAGS